MNFGFSVIGLIFLIILFFPNILWTKNKPKDYDIYVKNESKILSVLERIGQILVVCFSLIWADSGISIWLILAFISMVLYEMYWIRYFRSQKRMEDMFTGFLGIPLAGSTLPVFAFLLLAVHEKNVFLFVSTIILGIGHIGIHLAHKNEVS